MATQNTQQEANAPPAGPTLKDQAGKLLAQAAGLVGARTIATGLRFGLFEELARHPSGLTAQALATRRGVDPFYADVWCRSAFAAEALEAGTDGTWRLAPHLGTLLLDGESPAYMAGAFAVLDEPEVFPAFNANLASGKRIWWDECGPSFIQGVSASGRAFYNRLIPAGLERVPGLVQSLQDGARVLELACGSGTGLAKLAARYPRARLVGVDGDAYSLGLARQVLDAAQAADRVELVQSPLEDVAWQSEFDLALINISMHECRDIEKVTANVKRALRPGAAFVISDFPFPETPEGLRTAPGRTMAGIQVFEALIGDQLLPTRAFVELLRRHGFQNVDAFELTPMHVVIHGRA